MSPVPNLDKVLRMQELSFFLPFFKDKKPSFKMADDVD